MKKSLREAGLTFGKVFEFTTWCARYYFLLAGALPSEGKQIVSVAERHAYAYMHLFRIRGKAPLSVELEKPVGSGRRGLQMKRPDSAPKVLVN